MTELKTTASLTDGSAHALRYLGSWDATGSTAGEELTLKWDAMNNDDTKGILDAFITATKQDNVKADTDQAYGDDWYIGYQPDVRENDQRSCTVTITLTKETLTQVLFPYRDRSVTAYTAVKTPTYTATRERFKNATSQPTLSEPYGSLSVILNLFNRWDGEKTVRTYATNEFAPSSGMKEQTIEPYDVRGFVARSKDGTPDNKAYILTTNLKLNRSSSTVQTYVNSPTLASRIHPITLIALGRITYNRRYDMWFGYQVTWALGTSL